MNRYATTVMDGPGIKRAQVSAYRVPAATQESDGTLSWNHTTLVLVQVEAGDKTGTGYTYAGEATAHFIKKELLDQLPGRNVFDIAAVTQLLTAGVRNSGQCGIAMMAVSAVDIALWDLKARILGLPLCRLLGQVRDGMPVYGSGGFTSYTKEQLQQQFSGWAEAGIRYMKMKIGRHPEDDLRRIGEAAAAAGEGALLMVDANGAYTVRQALDKAQRAAAYKVIWMEEPVRSDNLEGLRFIREHAPAQVQIAAGEYGYTPAYFQAMLHAGAVDVLQADATRCGGISGFLKAGQLAEAWQTPFSSHCAPAVHLHAALALPSFYLAEYFYDHYRLENMLFDGARPATGGQMAPDLTRPGLGLDFKFRDAEKYEL